MDLIDDIRILIVDDTITNINLLKVILKKKNYQIDYAQSGIEAIDLIKKNPPDLVLLDIMMPDVDGFETCKKIKALPEGIEIPVIFLTSLTNVDAIVKGFKAGAVDYITKPFNGKELLIRIKTHIELMKIRRQQVESEKMASLAGLTAGVAHEINTPLGSGLTAISYLENILKIFTTQFHANTLKKSDFVKFLKNSQEANQIVFSCIKKAAHLVKSFKKVAVDKTSHKRHHFNVREFIETIIINLESQLNEKKITTQIECDPSLIINNYSNEFSQIIVTLFKNSIIHAFKSDQQKEIQIQILKTGNNLQLVFSDNGEGISSENLPMIYEPFFTTDRTQGCIGLGLHIVYNIIHHKLGGTIICKSEQKKGSIFYINIPL